MNKFLSSVLALMLVAGLAAPSFAWDADNCPFIDTSMCGAPQSLADGSED